MRGGAVDRSTRVVRTAAWRAIYEFAAWLRPEDTFLNYGYSGPVPNGGLPSDVHMALYHLVGDAVDLPGRDVLEVGCGRGAGAAYLVQTFRPRRLIAADVAMRHIRLCERRYRMEGLSFARADAHALPFAADEFDVMLSVESSHCLSLPSFLHEARRVLRPNGHLVLADVRRRGANTALHRALETEGFALVQERDLTAHVVRARTKATAPAHAAVRRHSAPIRAGLLCWAAAAGTPLYKKLKSGRLQYTLHLLRKSL